MTSTGPLKLSKCLDTNRRGKDCHFLAVYVHCITRSRREVVPKEQTAESGHCSLSIVTLSAGPGVRPRSCNLCTLYEQQQSKQTGATSVSEEAVVFVVGVSMLKNLLVRSQQEAGHRHSATLQTQQKELTFLDTDTISETRRPFQWNSFTHHPPRNTNKPTQTQCGKNTKLLHWWISQMHFPSLLVQNCLTREISQNSKQPVLIHHSLKFTITNNWHIIWGLSNFKMYHRLKQTKTALDFYFRGNCRNKKTR